MKEAKTTTEPQPRSGRDGRSPFDNSDIVLSTSLGLSAVTQAPLSLFISTPASIAASDYYWGQHFLPHFSAWHFSMHSFDQVHWGPSMNDVGKIFLFLTILNLFYPCNLPFWLAPPLRHGISKICVTLPQLWMRSSERALSLLLCSATSIKMTSSLLFTQSQTGGPYLGWLIIY